MKNELVKQCYTDYYEHENKLNDDNYAYIYALISLFEGEWNEKGANLKYDLDINGDFLCINNIKICKMNELQYIYAEEDAIICRLENEKSLYIVIRWTNEIAYISQIYIEHDNNDHTIMLYEK